MQPTDEEWRPVRGHVGYEVSNLGNVRSYRLPGKTLGLATEPQLLKLLPMKIGYVSVVLAEPRKRRYVHALVADAFLGPRPPRAQIAHGDGAGTNNVVSNLRYATPAQNSADRRAHGTFLMGELGPTAKLSAEQVKAIRDAYGPYVRCGRGKISQRELAEQYNVCQQAISLIVSGDRWAHA